MKIIYTIGILLQILVFTAAGQDVDKVPTEQWPQPLLSTYDLVTESHDLLATYLLRKEIEKLSESERFEFLYGNNGRRHYDLIFTARYFLSNAPSDSSYRAFYYISEILDDSAEGSQMLSEIIGKIFMQDMSRHLNMLEQIEDLEIVESLVHDIFFIAPADSIYDHVRQNSDSSAIYYDAVMEYKADAEFARGLRK